MRKKKKKRDRTQQTEPKERYLASMCLWGRAVDFYTMTPQESHNEILDFLLDEVHEVVVDGETYMQADYPCHDRYLKNLCEKRRYGF